MNPSIVVVIALFCYFIGYRFYSKKIARVFGLRDDENTPAQQVNDGIDFIPTNKFILLGHHFASIAGLGPILGPVVAVIWGWFPALVWVVFGTLFIGAVHDFAALILSVRSKGLSIGALTEKLIGKRAKFIFLIIIFFLVALAMGVFVIVLGFLFSSKGYPSVVSPTMLIMFLAIIIGYLSYKKGLSIKKLGLIASLLIIIVAWFSGNSEFTSWVPISNKEDTFSQDSWMMVMLAYAFLASVLPVWLLLQTRDFLNSILLFLALAILYLGFFLTDTSFAPEMVISKPKNAPPIFPFVFVIIACGALSGFHSLVSSGTTSKQIANEKDARMIGYGSMVLESLLGLMAILATTTTVTAVGFAASYHDWSAVQGLGPKLTKFIQGCSTFLTSLNINKETGEAIIAFIVVSFALTSLDSATRLLRYNIEELASFLPNANKKNSFNFKRIIQNRYTSSLLAVVAIGFFAYFKVGDKPAGLALWQLFGITNQLLGSLALMAASVYLYSRNKNPLYTLIPMVLMLITTCFAIVNKSIYFYQNDSMIVLFLISMVLMVLTVWLLIESSLAIRNYRKSKIESLQIY